MQKIVVVLAIVIFALVIVGNGSRIAVNTYIEQQAEQSNSLTKQMSEKIYHFFILPALLANGAIELRNEEQYERLHKLMLEIKEDFSLKAASLSSFNGGEVVYSLHGEQGGQPRFFPREECVPPVSVFESSVTLWTAGFLPFAGKERYLLHTYGALCVAASYPGGDVPVPSGWLEFTRDITPDIEQLISAQRCDYFSAMIVFVAFVILMVWLNRRKRA